MQKKFLNQINKTDVTQYPWFDTRPVYQLYTFRECTVEQKSFVDVKETVELLLGRKVESSAWKFEDGDDKNLYTLANFNDAVENGITHENDLAAMKGN